MTQSAAEKATTDYIENFDDRILAANAIVRKYTYISAGVGVIPVPLIDLMALSGVQMCMIRNISALYNVAFKDDISKNIISSLVGSVAPVGVGSVLIRAIPVINIITMPALSGASTYALGKVMIQHLESGGTFLDFDPASVRKHFKKEFKSAPANSKSPK